MANKETALSNRITKLWDADFNPCRTGAMFGGCREDFEFHAGMVLEGSVADAALAEKLAGVLDGPNWIVAAYRGNYAGVQGAFLDEDDFTHHVHEVEAGRTEDPHANLIVEADQIERERGAIQAQLDQFTREGVVPASVLHAREVRRQSPHLKEIAI